MTNEVPNLPQICPLPRFAHRQLVPRRLGRALLIGNWLPDGWGGHCSRAKDPAKPIAPNQPFVAFDLTANGLRGHLLNLY
ncbi:hypothetical protein [Mangrovibacterium lignilyticum]|uniref:hypothetical protein n=1 Tax=Mangrovibacterium lignilyticum TaxID=2668052 RepID=UPI0013D76E51|nr:hypothetical protein [Mangrovibacterium lignilyticum]